jgi:periplasmic glucans biosynthesis protein
MRPAPEQIAKRGMAVRRRDVVLAAAFAPLLGLTEPLLRRASAETKDDAGFSHEAVRQLARDLAQKPYQPPDASLPPELKDLSYDQYRAIRFLPDHAWWRAEHLPFEMQFFHRGFYYSNRVDVFDVNQGRAQRIPYSSTMFSFGDIKPPDPSIDLGFAGFRLHYPINRPDYHDEVAVFLGATYFRAVAKGQHYGLSARGLAIKTADPEGEEFPVFKSFWVERPQPNATSIVVHALLDSQSLHDPARRRDDFRRRARCLPAR